MSLDLSTVQEVLNKIRSSGTRLYHANRDEYWTESFAINKTEQFIASRNGMCKSADIATAFDFILSDLSDIMKLLKGKGYYVSVSDVIVSGEYVDKCLQQVKQLLSIDHHVNVDVLTSAHSMPVFVLQDHIVPLNAKLRGDEIYDDVFVSNVQRCVNDALNSVSAPTPLQSVTSSVMSSIGINVNSRMNGLVTDIVMDMIKGSRAVILIPFTYIESMRQEMVEFWARRRFFPLSGLSSIPVVVRNAILNAKPLKVPSHTGGADVAGYCNALFGTGHMLETVYAADSLYKTLLEILQREKFINALVMALPILSPGAGIGLVDANSSLSPNDVVKMMTELKQQTREFPYLTFVDNDKVYAFHSALPARIVSHVIDDVDSWIQTRLSDSSVRDAVSKMTLTDSGTAKKTSKKKGAQSDESDGPESRIFSDICADLPKIPVVRRNTPVPVHDNALNKSVFECFGVSVDSLSDNEAASILVRADVLYDVFNMPLSRGNACHDAIVSLSKQHPQYLRFCANADVYKTPMDMIKMIVIGNRFKSLYDEIKASQIEASSSSVVVDKQASPHVTFIPPIQVMSDDAKTEFKKNLERINGLFGVYSRATTNFSTDSKGQLPRYLMQTLGRQTIAMLCDVIYKSNVPDLSNPTFENIPHSRLKSAIVSMDDVVNAKAVPSVGDYITNYKRACALCGVEFKATEKGSDKGVAYAISKTLIKDVDSSDAKTVLLAAVGLCVYNVYKTVLCFGMDEIPVIMDDLVGRVTQPVFKGINNLKDVVLMSEANIENESPSELALRKEHVDRLPAALEEVRMSIKSMIKSETK